MKTIGIFISSTFKDMDAERDIVVSVLKPAIESALAFKHVSANVQIVDLRWGVNTQDVPEEERESKVLNECLDYIRTSKPFFIGFVGDRYGWIPPQSRWSGIVESMSDVEKSMMGNDLSDVRSVTELEMLFGVLNESDALPSSFFFLRKPDVYNQMNLESKSIFCDSDPKSIKRLESLKQKIRTTYLTKGYTGNVIEYDCTWNGSSLEIDEEAIKSIVDPLVRTIMSGIDIDEAENSEIDDIIRLDNSLIQERCSYYVPNKKLINSIFSRIESSTPLIVKSDDGMGKTSLLAYLFHEFSSQENTIPFIHFASKAGYNSTCEVMLKKFLWLLPSNDFPKLPLSVEAHPTLLIQYLIQAAESQDKHILLLIDNIQYLHDLNLIIEYLSQSKKISIIATSNVDIDYFQDGENASYITIPNQTEDSTKEIASLFMSASHKVLPSKVVTSLTSKKSHNGLLACHCPLWTILTLNHLVCLDLNDFARLRNIADADDAEKITIYLQSIIEISPSITTLLVGHLLENLESKEEYLLGKNLLEDVNKYGFTSIERLRMNYAKNIPFLSYQKVSKILQPLFINDYLAKVTIVSSDILNNNPKVSTSIVPIETSNVIKHLSNRLYRLTQILDVFSKYGFTDAFETVSTEFNMITPVLSHQMQVNIVESAKSHVWTELTEIIEDKIPERAFFYRLSKFKETYSNNDRLLLSISYWYLNSRYQYELGTVNDRNLFSQKISILDSAFNEMNVINQKSLLAILANVLYFDIKSDYEKYFCGNLTYAIHYKSLEEREAKILYINNPSYTHTYRYASRLDENSSNWFDYGTKSSQQRRYIEIGEKKNRLAITMFKELMNKKPSDSLLVDLYMAEVRRTNILSTLDIVAAISWNEKLIEEMEQAIAIPGVLRQLAFAYDYQSRYLLRLNLTDEAIKQVTKAIKILSNQPQDMETVHSIATLLKTYADIHASRHSLTGAIVQEFKKYAYIPLKNNPNDAVAIRQYMMANVLDMYCHYENKEIDGLYELSMHTIQLMEFVLTSGSNIRYLQVEYFVPALEFALKNISPEQRDTIVTRYNMLITELINRRLINPNQLDFIQ